MKQMRLSFFTSGRTGIYVRSIAGDDEFASDMAVKASSLLFSNNGVKPETIDYLLLCTQSPDYFLPTTACILQNRLNLSSVTGALDFNLGCSVYIYGLSLAKGLIMSNQASNLLLITSETYSKYIHPDDKSNKTIFVDGATATLLTGEPGSNISARIGEFVFYTDGKGFDKLIVRNGGIRNRSRKGSDERDKDGLIINNDDFIYMDGRAIFEFTVLIVPPLIEKTLEKNGISKDDVDLFIFHQANAFMMESVRKRCKIPEEKFFIFIKDCANTVSSTIPIALKEALNQGRIRRGMKILLTGFGVGLSAAAVIIECV